MGMQRQCEADFPVQRGPVATRARTPERSPALLRMSTPSPLTDDASPLAQTQMPFRQSGSTERSQEATSCSGDSNMGSTVQIPKRALGTVVDPIEKALLITHRLTWVAQLPPESEEGGSEGGATVAAASGSSSGKSRELKRILQQHHRWLFGVPANASVLIQ